MGQAIVVNKDNFASEVENAKGAVLVDFYADWCGGCQRVGPIVEELAGEYNGRAKVCKVNMDNDRELAEKFDIMSIPSLIFFKDGEVKDIIVGAVPKKELASKLDALLK